ncbi:MAG: RNA methyltransferase [Candidatus Woesearchaeota archaeon]
MIHIILLEPVIPGNVGAIARVMKNFGFEKLVLVGPHCDHLCDEARNRAKHAQEILDNAEVSEFFVVEEYDYLIATTAKMGSEYNISRSPLTPEELARKVKGIDPNKRIALVIGREGPGMFNEEIAKCDFITTIPADPAYPTLNISHSVAVLLYALHSELAANSSASHVIPIGKQEKDHLLRMFNELFDRLHWETPERRETQETLWKRVLGKAMLTKREAFAVMGLLTKVLYKIGDGNPKPVLKSSSKPKQKQRPQAKPNKPTLKTNTLTKVRKPVHKKNGKRYK